MLNDSASPYCKVIVRPCVNLQVGLILFKNVVKSCLKCLLFSGKYLPLFFPVILFFNDLPFYRTICVSRAILQPQFLSSVLIRFSSFRIPFWFSAVNQNRIKGSYSRSEEHHGETIWHTKAYFNCNILHNSVLWWAQHWSFTFHEKYSFGWM